VLLGLPEYELTAVEERARQIHLRARFVGRISCAHEILPRLRATETFRRRVCQKHFDGISRSRLAQRERLSSAKLMASETLRTIGCALR
jgi:hypothetical protein